MGFGQSEPLGKLVSRGSNDVAHVGLGIVIEGPNAGGAAEQHFLTLEDTPMFDWALTERCPIHGAVVKRVFGVRCFCPVGSLSGLKGGNRGTRCRVVGGGAGGESSSAGDKRKNAEESFHVTP